ncbi:hypothetical protein COCSUDRAFT_32854 [Coccomyxa subellipsoidea C-169]|uniref:Uncharacterized protein n=1 Tax=Coccomyxa subellipsoidea (strain C-169) TaxID=574566 RepID=I0Z2J6_COCSC|nr:hypothetical protein COCSUDRAFT_32854 [Coccomyxa subellipsoidea C-169]EIE24865.1 hypothetical protein COCSUDRAFT_32854 [Coccomyxa subellipsoidea C-169]|eukprot:XP_005649409.1 hypothetical protein COCSUDRAFT_32854 [Coccomyxa subellipsoidea C-169]
MYLNNTTGSKDSCLPRNTSRPANISTPTAFFFTTSYDHGVLNTFMRHNTYDKGSEIITRPQQRSAGTDIALGTWSSKHRTAQ